MNILGVAQNDAEGGLFDFNATLPLMDLQLILVIGLLTVIFYRPFDFILKQREVRLTNSLTASSRGLAQATELYVQYRSSLKKLIQNGIQSCEQVESAESKAVSTKLSIFLNHAETLLNTCGVAIGKS